VVDTDMDFDDTAALAYLAQADKLELIDLRAVGVEISGVAFAGNGLSHARCLLDRLGLPQVPVSDGDRTRTNNVPMSLASS
jgi:purine nucleosidase